MSTPMKWANEIKAMADGKVLECDNEDGSWFVPITLNPVSYPCFKWRIKPATIRIGNYDVPEPVREALEVGEKYFVAHLFGEIESWIWRGDYKWSGSCLKRGLIFRTKEDAELATKAIIELLGGTV